jgi:hypothetical protein
MITPVFGGDWSENDKNNGKDWFEGEATKNVTIKLSENDK